MPVEPDVTPAAPTPAEPVPVERAPARGPGRGMPDAVLSFGLTLVVGLLSAVVISRLYGVETIGEYALVAAPYALVLQFSGLGEHLALVRSLSRDAPSSRRAASVWLVVLAFSTAVTLAVALVVAPVAVLLLRGPADQPDLVAPALVLVAAYVVLGNLSWNCDTLQVAFRGTRALLVGRFFDVAFLLAASVALAVVGTAEVGDLVVAQVLTFALGLVLRLTQLRRILTGRPSRASLREATRELPELLRFAVRIAPGALAQGLTQQAGTWIIGAVRPLAVLGAYSRANNLASRLTDAGYRLGEVLLPSLSRSCAQGEHAEACRRFSRWRRLVVLALLAACAPLAGAGEGVLAVFGPGFAQAWVPLALLLLGYAAGVVTLMQAQFLYALGHPGVVSRLALLRAAVSLALIAPLTVRAGASGAAAALLAGFALELLLAVRTTERRLATVDAGNAPVRWPSVLAAAGVAVAVARGLDLMLPTVPGALAAGLGGLAAYAGVLVVLRLVLPAEVRALVAARRGRAGPA